MKKILLFAFLFKISVNNFAQTKSSNPTTKPYIGTFYGLQESHSIGKFRGEDIIVPDADYRFYLDNKNEVELAQSANGKTYYYLGKYLVKKMSNGDFLVTCNVTSYPKKGSNPTYRLTFKSDGKILCNQTTDIIKPTFELEKRD
jgi:hypothetical protein